jgi:uncharacterized delta-60 repeat protein
MITRIRFLHMFLLQGLLIALLAVPQSAAFAATTDGFNPGADGDVYALALQPDGKILVGGAFGMLGGQAQYGLGRVNADGSLDTTFSAGISGGQVDSLLVQPDGKIVVGGAFTSLGGQTQPYLARLNPDGSLDTDFRPTLNGAVEALGLQPDGFIIAVGDFTLVNAYLRPGVARIRPGGGIDENFSVLANGLVYSTAVQPDGKILIGGPFSKIGAVARSAIARLNEDGSLDADFNPVVTGGYVDAFALQPDGKILLGGRFQYVAGQSRSNFARLNQDGSLDVTLNLGTNDDVMALALQTDGKILLGGAFTTFAGQPFNRITRLMPDGSLETNFNPGADNMIFALALQGDGSILVGGRFITLGGQSRSKLGRLTSDIAAVQQLTSDAEGTSLTWMRSGSSPEVSRVTFEWSSDATTYTTLGAGSRITGGWQLSGIQLPGGANLWVRARGYYPTGSFGGSSSIAESIASVFVTTPVEDCKKSPGVPHLLSSATYSDMSTLRVSLDWDDTPCALLYQVRVRHNRSNGLIADVGLTQSSNFVTRRLLPGRYYWQVRACNRSGCGEWSELREFRVLRKASQ